jgi:hypothetical protein
MMSAQTHRLFAGFGLGIVALVTLLIAGSLQAQGNLATIDWEAARAEGRSALSLRLSTLVSLSKEDSDRIGLPVLLPARDEIANSLRLSPMDNLYTATLKDGTVTITITGSRIVAGTAAPPPGGARSERIERTDTGLDLYFSRFGAAYVISIECPSPDSDVQCANDDYALALKESLAVVMPRETRSQQ